MKLLTRITSSGKTIKYIDGLRFFAVMSVLLFHYIDYYSDHYPGYSNSKISEYPYLFGNAFFGVMLFFGISGFVLGLPLIKTFGQNEKFDIKNYLFRRLTRLEPPYIIQLVLFFLINLILGGKTLSYLFPHFISSLFYSHNIVFDTKPVINPVLWTLEIEVQFYLLAPIFGLLFKLNKYLRRGIFLVLIFITPQYTPQFSFPTLLGFYHFFLIGMLAVDFYIEFKDKIKPHFIFDILGFISIFIIWVRLTSSTVFLFAVFYVLVFSGFSIFWKKILEYKWVYIIGGMCYTIYILHQKVMFYGLSYFFPHTVLGGSVESDFIIRLIFTLFIVFVCSCIFFIFVERPTMKKNWWKYRSLKKLFFE